MTVASTIGSGGLALYRAAAFQLCDLTGHRRVVAPNPLGEFDHPDRVSPLDDEKQQKQRTIAQSGGSPNHHLVPLGAIDDADDVDQPRV